MSSSDPTSTFDSLNVSSESMDVPAAVGEASSQRSNRSASSTPACPLQKFARAGTRKTQHVTGYQEFAKGS